MQKCNHNKFIFKKNINKKFSKICLLCNKTISEKLFDNEVKNYYKNLSENIDNYIENIKLNKLFKILKNDKGRKRI